MLCKATRGEHFAADPYCLVFRVIPFKAELVWCWGLTLELVRGEAFFPSTARSREPMHELAHRLLHCVDIYAISSSKPVFNCWIFGARNTLSRYEVTASVAIASPNSAAESEVPGQGH